MRPVFAVLLTAVLAAGCSDRNCIVRENVENAKAQLAYLIEASEADDTLKIPSSFKNGKIKFVSPSNWVSGFFAGIQSREAMTPEKSA